MAAEESDQDLAKRARTGDRRAFEALVSRHKDALFRLARSYLGNSDDAYDITQDVFVAAWLALDRFDSSKDFGVWLRTIALNKCRDFSRRQTARRRMLRFFALEQSIRSTAQQIESRAIDEEAQRLEQLNKAIAELPAFYKAPLLLTMVNGLSQQAIADTLKTTPKAVEMRIRRARKKLNEKLKIEGEG